jgi:hypothetical protein
MTSVRCAAHAQTTLGGPSLFCVPTSAAHGADATQVVYLDEPYASVRWEDQRVVMEMKGFANSTQFRATQEALLLAIIENGAQRLLSDIRHAKLVLVEDERWLVEDLLPRLARTPLRYSALVMPQNQLALVIATDLTNAAQPPDGISVSEQFGSVDAAKAWLSTVGAAEAR